MKEKPNKKDKEFLKVPEYPGGKKALLDFIKSHLQYPADAWAEKVEGIARQFGTGVVDWPFPEDGSQVVIRPLATGSERRDEVYQAYGRTRQR
mgnify:CR=1 FL=1